MKMEGNEKRVAVLASGSGTNFLALAEGDTSPGKVVLLLTDTEGCGAIEKALSLGIEAHSMDPGKYRTRFSAEAETRWVKFLREREIDLVCLAGFMRILKGPLLEAYAGSIMNIHPSLLPAFPGLDAQGQAFRYGVKVAGCTVHYVDAGTDTGPVIIQSPVPVLPDDTRETLAARILEQEHRIFPMAVKAHCAGRLRIRGRHVYIKGCETDSHKGDE